MWCECCSGINKTFCPSCCLSPSASSFFSFFYATPSFFFIFFSFFFPLFLLFIYSSFFPPLFLLSVFYSFFLFFLLFHFFFSLLFHSSTFCISCSIPTPSFSILTTFPIVLFIRHFPVQIIFYFKGGCFIQ